MLPEAPEAGKRVVELGDLDLDPRLPRARPAGEDVENELRAIDDVDIEELLDVPRLGRRQIVVEDDEVRFPVVYLPGELLDLPLADEGGAVDSRSVLERAAHDRGSGGAGEELELAKVIELVPAPHAGQGHPDEVRSFDGIF
jgi:hypothetical protein